MYTSFQGQRKDIQWSLPLKPLPTELYGTPVTSNCVSAETQKTMPFQVLAFLTLSVKRPIQL